MEPHEYATLFDFETGYWWYRGLHLVLLDTLKALGLNDHPRVLDAGCGTGQHLVNVTGQLSPEAYGFDYAVHAARFWARRALHRVCRASVNEIPFRSGVFDAATCVDVLECEGVVEENAYGELWRVVKPGGHIILVVPAYQWLMTEEHHKAVGACRRYSRQSLAELVRTRPVEILRVTHVFGSLLPAVAAYRLALPYIRRGTDGPPTSELRSMHPMINELLFRIVKMERRYLRRFDVPFGSSIMAVVRKAG